MKYIKENIIKGFETDWGQYTRIAEPNSSEEVKDELGKKVVITKPKTVISWEDFLHNGWFYHQD